MNRSPQTDAHPDADSLSAFAEHALPEAERGPIVAHMAGCARCREVVFLAQAAAELDAPAAIATDSATAGADEETGRLGGVAAGSRRGWRFPALWPARNWALVIPAAALAAGAGLVFWVEKQPTEATVERAQVQAPENRGQGSENRDQRSENREQRSGVRDQRSENRDQRSRVRDQRSGVGDQGSEGRGSSVGIGSVAGSGVSAPLAAGKAAAGHEARAKKLAASPEPSPAMSQVQAAPADQAQLPYPASGGPELAGGGAALPTLSLPVTAAPQGRPGLGADSGQHPTQLSAAATTVHPKLNAPGVAELRGDAAVPGAEQPGVHGTLTNAPISSVRAGVQGFAGRRVLMAPAKPSPELFAAGRAAPFLLPDGRRPIAAATLRDRTVALDVDGRLFLSQNAGKAWEAVGSRWKGKAILLTTNVPGALLFSAVTRVQAGATEEAGSPQGAQAGGSDAAPPPATGSIGATRGPTQLFKLATDHGETWVSEDGKTWRLQQQDGLMERREPAGQPH